MAIPLNVMPEVAKVEDLPVSQAKAADAQAWAILLQRFRLPVYVYVFGIVHQEQAALDLVQETFVSAVRHIGSLQDEAKFGSWLFGIAHQKCIQQWRKQNREDDALREVAEGPIEFDDDPGQILIRREEEAEFQRLVDQLPVAQRSALLLYFVEDFSLEEIAGITGATLGTVKSRLHYAKKALKKLWKESK